MQLKESLETLKGLQDALPKLMALSEPLSRAGDLAALESKIAAGARELDRIEADIRKAREDREAAEASATAANRIAAGLSASIGEKAFADSKPARDAAEAQIASLRDSIVSLRQELSAVQAAIEEKNQELAAIESKVELAKESARKILEG